MEDHSWVERHYTDDIDQAAIEIKQQYLAQ
jgi:hypothetical protein